MDIAAVDLNGGAANDNGVFFRFSGGTWVYNLSTASLGTGTHVIGIEVPDGRRLNAGFVLR